VGDTGTDQYPHSVAVSDTFTLTHTITDPYGTDS
jgi:hypothetical protein